MYKGWRNPLQMKDMWDLKPEDSSKALVPPFEEKFARNIEKSKRFVSLTSFLNWIWSVIFSSILGSSKRNTPQTKYRLKLDLKKDRNEKIHL